MKNCSLNYQPGYLQIKQRKKIKYLRSSIALEADEDFFKEHSSELYPDNWYVKLVGVKWLLMGKN